MTKYKSNLEEETAPQFNGYCKWQYEPFKLKYTIPESVHNYTPDFLLWKNIKGKKILIECKGGGPLYGLTEVTKQKMLLIKSQYPDLDIRFCFSNAKLKTGQGRGKPKITYSKWADIHGFPWCEKIIPLDWYKEL